ncbi:adventurous gliding motility protein AgmC [Cystobacter fuscus]
MSTPIIKKWLAAVLCVLALGSTAAVAGPDTFYLGEGTENKTVSTIDTKINTYAQVTADITANTKSIQVGPAVGAATSIHNGSLIMILQTTGIEPVPVSGDTAPINLNGKPVGTWELARVENVSDSGSGATLTLKEPLVRGYTKDVTQVIVVAEYATLTVSASSSIIALPWDGKVGGVVAFLVQGALTIQGTTSTTRGRISANAAGFRGGAFKVDQFATTGCADLDQSSPSGGLKGEGIANTKYGPDYAGRGNVANGGGGGVCSLSGGGGGAGAGTSSSPGTGVGAGAGGMGGNSVDDIPQAGGLGGAALYFTESNRLMFGGGGGAGHGLTSPGQSAGNGGGIVFVRAGSLVGSGRFEATGATPEQSANAGGGGGGGGTIHIRFAGNADCNSLEAGGGAGGGTTETDPGPGGGGGGGYVFFQAVGGTCSPKASSIFLGNAGIPRSGTTTAKNGANGHFVWRKTGFVSVTPVIQTPTNGAVLRTPPTVISGTAEGNSTLTLELTGPNGTTTYSLPVDNSTPGNWRLNQPTLPVLPDGTYTVTVRTTSVDGDTSPTVTSTFTVDTIAPTVAITAPANGRTSSQEVTEVTGTAEPAAR